MKTKNKIQFGDFQTPDELARKIATLLKSRGLRPASIVEPTCGLGNILEAAALAFPKARAVHGLELNDEHLGIARQRFKNLGTSIPIQLERADFFSFDWRKFLAFLPEPVLIIGNPPWVTASELGALDSANLPQKSNFQKRSGLDALTGKSNFDIAEWMLIHLIEWMRARRGSLAMLVKTSVARKVLHHAWINEIALANCAIYPFDAAKYFGVAVEASLFTCDMSPLPSPKSCQIFDLENPNKCLQTIAFEEGFLIADRVSFHRYRHLAKTARSESSYRWRSGIKHDCSRVMELRAECGALFNGFDERVDLEDVLLYPMLKGSEVANNLSPTRKMLVTQRETGEPTEIIQTTAPRTWAYLIKHDKFLEARGSSIYRNRPPFSIFGIGKYTFAPWKVAICALYKKLQFAVVGPHDGKPVVLDDTCYQLSFDNEREARVVAEMLNSDVARQFYQSFLFWDAKRAITSEILERLDLATLARELRVAWSPNEASAPRKKMKRDPAALLF